MAAWNRLSRGGRVSLIAAYSGAGYIAVLAALLSF
jgi:hypothetical protein